MEFYQEPLALAADVRLLREARGDLADAQRRITELTSELDQARADASAATNDALSIIDRQIRVLTRDP